MKKVLKEFGALNNVKIGGGRDIPKANPEVLQRAMQVDLMAPVLIRARIVGSLELR